ncbi:hypothetical protein [Nocardia goodfellowii]|uniref:Uncharacterized protein n=1 Tax=Nocardia goodfellowii TaxID=882446 RepID=A0ABS4Q841_9NOCA|nr:hypothetical protein [Nocardia goodfellowii]MBP2187859.1 hypothetical protein [Nocardia goodfellowii]
MEEIVRNVPIEDRTLHLTFLGKNTQNGGSPTLFATNRGTYVVQGWRVKDHDDQVEIPHRLLAHTEPGTCVGALLGDTGRGTFVLAGTPVTDAGALAEMNVPDHEAGIEVPVGKEVWVDATTAR